MKIKLMTNSTYRKIRYTSLKETLRIGIHKLIDNQYGILYVYTVVLSVCVISDITILSIVATTRS